MSRSYREFLAWQRAVELSVGIYAFTKDFPREEMFGLTSQLRRASVSIVSNIAEGHGRGSASQLIHFLFMARGSAYEVEAQLIVCGEVGLGELQKRQGCQQKCDEVCRMLRAAISTLRRGEGEGN
jgi:four helix bundle protein